MFIVLLFRLIYLQVIKGEENFEKVNASILRKIDIPAPRGEIYDRNGVLLAGNKIAYNVKFDNSIKKMEIKERNNIFESVLKILEEKDEEVYFDFPISKKEPYEFIWTQSKLRYFRKDMKLKSTLTAKEVMEELKDRFELTGEEGNFRNLIILNSEVYMRRYKQYQPITVCRDIKKETIAMIEENSNFLRGIYIDKIPVRYYRDNESLSHVLGYLTTINQEEYKKLKDKGYDSDDLIGRSGVEKTFEEYLRGEDGVRYMEVDKDGRRITELDTLSLETGKNVYLTIDYELQNIIYEEMLKKLAETALLNYNKKYTSRDIFMNLVKIETISIDEILESDEYYSKILRKKIFKYLDGKNEKQQKEELIRLIKNYKVTSRELVFILMEQGIIKSDYKKSLASGKISTDEVIRRKIESLEITPDMIGQKPYSAAVAAIDTNTGEVRALVSYPSYNNNEVLKNYNKISQNSTKPFINRALAEKRAPGSTFKMLTAIAALSEGVITDKTKIVDKGVYPRFGNPKCWIYTSKGTTHGVVDVYKGLATSCNYFFYEVGYRLGFAKGSGKFDASLGAERIAKYGKMFDLNKKSGIELSEFEATPNLASPGTKEKLVKLYNPKANRGDTMWYPGDTIRSAIGQSVNNLAPIHVAKYTSIIANEGKKYDIHILREVKDDKNNVVFKKKIELIEEIPVKNDIMKIAKQGMYDVTNGVHGTAKYYFRDSEVIVAGKTGTAQEGSKGNHAWFTSFAPYENPEIAITAMVPFGNESKEATKIVRASLNRYYKENKEEINKTHKLNK
jgi:cell division protein FtsI/penicillin-binding protein 2